MKRRSLKTVTHKGKLAVEYSDGSRTIAIIPTARPLLTIAELIKNMEEDIHKIVNVEVVVTYN